MKFAFLPMVDLCLAESDSRGKSLRCSGGERGGAWLDAPQRRKMGVAEAMPA